MKKSVLFYFLFLCLSMYFFVVVSNLTYAKHILYEKDILKIPIADVSALNGILPFGRLWLYSQGDNRLNRNSLALLYGTAFFRASWLVGLTATHINYRREILKISPFFASTSNVLFPIFGLWSYLKSGISLGIEQTLLMANGGSSIIAGTVSSDISGVVKEFYRTSIGAGIILVELIFFLESWILGGLEAYLYFLVSSLTPKEEKEVVRSTLLENQILQQLQSSANVTNTNQIIFIPSNSTTKDHFREIPFFFPALLIYNYNFDF